jgi:hypothetical protein
MRILGYFARWDVRFWAENWGRGVSMRYLGKMGKKKARRMGVKINKS